MVLPIVVSVDAEDLALNPDTLIVHELTVAPFTTAEAAGRLSVGP